MLALAGDVQSRDIHVFRDSSASVQSTGEVASDKSRDTRH